MSIFNTGKSLFKKVKVVPIFLTISDDFSPYAAVAIHSLTQHLNPERYYRVIILSDKLSFMNWVRLRGLVTRNCEIQFKTMSRSLYLKVITAYCAKRRGAGDYFSKAVYYYRAFIPNLFPLYEKAIYIDSDTVLRGDIGELFDTDLEGKALAAMVDPKVSEIPEFREYVENAVGVPCTEYVNSGVQVMDLKKMRKLKYLPKMINLIKKYDADLVAPDQDYLNVILQGDIKHIGSEWNEVPSKDLPRGTKLIHYNLFNKPWHYKNVASERIFWSAAKGTGFFNDLRRQRDSFTEEDRLQEEAKTAALIKKAARLAKTKEPLMKLEDE